MRRRIVWFLLIALSVPCLAFGPAVLTDADVARQALTVQQTLTKRPVVLPDVHAAAAILVNPTSGEVIWAKNENERRAPASLTKIVTASVALQHMSPDQRLVTTSADIYTYSVLGIDPGEGLTLKELLYYLLLPSDNCAAMAIARCVGGDVATFVGWMNDLAAAWGMSNTHFMNPHGLDKDGAYTTARDIALAAYHAMRNPIFADIVSTQTSYQGGRNVENTNQLLGLYSGTIGVKTGTTDEAGDCLAAWVKRPTGSALTVVLGSDDRYVDSAIILDYFFANYAEVSFDLPASNQNRYRDSAGNWRPICLKAPIGMLVHPSLRELITFYRRIDTTDPAHDPAQPVGVLQIRLGESILREEPIYLRQ